MEQIEFTNYVISKIVKQLPQFVKVENDTPSYIDIELSSRKGILTLWVGTEDEQITIGISGDASSGWHMHLNTFNNCILDNEIERAIQIISNIINDETKIHYSITSGYTLNKVVDINNIQRSALEVKYWGQL